MNKLLPSIFLTAFGLLFMLGALPWFGVALATGEWFWALGGVAFLGAGGFAASLGIRQLLARAVFQVASLKVTGPAQLGGSAQAQLVLMPKRPLVLTPGRCTLALRTLERARYSAGTQSRTYTHPIREDRLPFDVPAQLPTTGLVREFAVPIPRDIPPSWTGSSNSLKTTLELALVIEQWPDLALECEITVLPEIAP